ncbi:MAG: ABC transporter ATP-binding protein [Erysipelotrichaceae bacterium]|nr:ABC transporter ATP-binding protein [Erysipelotrichaceae bacterium]
MIRRFISYYKNYLGLFMVDMGCSMGISLLGMFYPIITRMMLNDFIPNQKFNEIVKFGIILLLVYFAKMVMKYCVDFYGHMCGTYMQADMRREMFRKIESLPFSYFDNNETGKIMTRIGNDLFEIAELAHHGPETILTAVSALVFAFIYLSNINLNLTLIIFGCSPFLLVIALYVRKRHLDASRASREALAEINIEVNSSVSGVRVTKAFSNSDKEMEKFEKGNVSFVDAKRKQYRSMAILHSTTNFVTDVFNVVCLISGGIYLYNGQISFGDYSVFILSINLFVSPVMQLLNFMEQFENGITGFEKFVEVMDEPVEEDSEDAKDYNNLNGDIKFDDVSFSYTDKEDAEVLNHISFNIKKGTTVALVGPSGGGKTTICSLLPKFYHVESGQISIDGIDIEKISMKSLRENIGIVQQDVFLFSGTIYENILYGRLDASEEEVIAAAKKANIYDYVMSLPDGFDTEIGERGVKLSGGQKQRLSIARVFLKNPSVLILDEATSALDNATEVLIQHSLNTLKEGRTTLVVAHRLSTIKNADKILVVSNGEIVEEGTHSDLLNKNGIYTGLYRSQFAQEEKLDDRLMMS